MIGQISARTSFETAPNQPRTSSEPASVMEFGLLSILNIASLCMHMLAYLSHKRCLYSAV